jgi:hypothetical protein
LTQKITDVSVSGEMPSLINTINAMIDQLTIFAAEVKKVAQEVGMKGKLGVQAEVGSVQGIFFSSSVVEGSLFVVQDSQSTPWPGA